jgi:hypothetical protein
VRRLLGSVSALASVLTKVGARRAARLDGVTLAYRAFGRSNTIDQTLWISNARAFQAAIPTIEVFPQDDRRQVLMGVSVEGLFGALDGKVLIPPGAGFDILRFSGDGAGQVRHVAARVTSVQWVPYPHPRTKLPTTADFLDDQGTSVTRFDDFTSIAVTNPNSFDINVAILYIVWTDPSLPPPQQARLAALFQNPIALPASGKATVGLSDDVRSVMSQRGDNAAVSVKLFQVP